jgi:hypothetical protein
MLRILSRPQTIGVARVGARPAPPPASPIAEAEFVARVRALVDEAGAGGEAERSVSPDEPILVSAPVPVRPSPVPRRPTLHAERTLERFLLEHNGGNPVLEATP